MSYHKKHFSILFHTFYRPLCLYALRILGDTDTAEDVVQDTFAVLWEKRESLSQIANSKSYLYTAVRNNSLMRLRNKPDFIYLEEVHAEELIPEEEIERAELEARLWQMLDELPARQREILLMAKRDGMRYKEIAEETGLSIKTVENHVTKALKTLRKKDLRIYLYFFV